MTGDDVLDGLRPTQGTHSVGGILGLLAEAVEEEADVGWRAGHRSAEERSQLVVSATGLGVDAIRQNRGGARS